MHLPRNEAGGTVAYASAQQGEEEWETAFLSLMPTDKYVEISGRLCQCFRTLLRNHKLFSCIEESLVIVLHLMDSA